MILTQNMMVPALYGEQERRTYVYIPDYAEEDEGARFPVLYMFDGQNVFFDEDATFGKSWGMQSYLEYSGAPVIVAAVECNYGENNERLSEYSPFTFMDPKFGKIRGRGRQTMDWFAGEFKPMIDSEFPTMPERRYTMIAGSSMGGLMSLYALMYYNDVYSRAAALSPSISFSPDKIKHMIRNAHLDPDTTLYMDCGETEVRYYRESDVDIHSYIDICSMLLRRGVKLTSRVVQYGEHTEASWERQVPFFMDTLLYAIEDEI